MRSLRLTFLFSCVLLLQYRLCCYTQHYHSLLKFGTVQLIWFWDHAVKNITEPHLKNSYHWTLCLQNHFGPYDKSCTLQLCILGVIQSVGLDCCAMNSQLSSSAEKNPHSFNNKSIFFNKLFLGSIINYNVDKLGVMIDE